MKALGLVFTFRQQFLRMKVFPFTRFVFCILLTACLSAFNLNAQTATAEKPVETFQQFQARLEKAATNARFDSALLGIKVESLDTGKLIYEQNADKLLKPASNGKMYTGAMALTDSGRITKFAHRSMRSRDRTFRENWRAI